MQVRIDNATRDFRDPILFKKGDFKNLRGIPVITCTVTYDNVKEWRIETINPNNGTVGARAGWGVVRNLLALAIIKILNIKEKDFTGDAETIACLSHT